MCSKEFVWLNYKSNFLRLNIFRNLVSKAIVELASKCDVIHFITNVILLTDCVLKMSISISLRISLNLLNIFYYLCFKLLQSWLGNNLNLSRSIHFRWCLQSLKSFWGCFRGDIVGPSSVIVLLLFFDTDTFVGTPKLN